MALELDRVSAVISFVAVIVAGIAGLIVFPVGMTTETILMIVLPSMVVFGAIMFVIGLGYGQYHGRD